MEKQKAKKALKEFEKKKKKKDNKILIKKNG